LSYKINNIVDVNILTDTLYRGAINFRAPPVIEVPVIFPPTDWSPLARGFLLTRFETVYAIHVLDNGWILWGCELGYAYLSKDGGNSFIALPKGLGTTDYANGNIVSFESNGSIVMALRSSNYETAISYDYGETWGLGVPTNYWGGNTGNIIRSGETWMRQTSSAIERSTNNGVSWSEVAWYLHRCLATDGLGTWVSITSNGSLVYSTNDGASWGTKFIPSTQAAPSVGFCDGIWYLGYDNKLYAGADFLNPVDISASLGNSNTQIRMFSASSAYIIASGVSTSGLDRPVLISEKGTVFTRLPESFNCGAVDSAYSITNNGEIWLTGHSNGYVAISE